MFKGRAAAAKPRQMPPKKHKLQASISSRANLANPPNSDSEDDEDVSVHSSGRDDADDDDADDSDASDNNSSANSFLDKRVRRNPRQVYRGSERIYSTRAADLKKPANRSTRASARISGQAPAQALPYYAKVNPFC